MKKVSIITAMRLTEAGIVCTVSFLLALVYYSTVMYLVTQTNPDPKYSDIFDMLRFALSITLGVYALRYVRGHARTLVVIGCALFSVDMLVVMYANRVVALDPAYNEPWLQMCIATLGIAAMLVLIFGYTRVFNRHLQSL